MMNNRGKSFLMLGIILSFFVILLLTYLAFANTSVTTSAGAANFNVNEDVQFIYNITINNTGTVNNITQVNITLPTGFTYTTGTANSSRITIVFSNTSTVLSWYNATSGSHLVLNKTWVFFWFNASAATPGNYNFSIATLYTGDILNYTNFTVIVNDTTAPSTTDYQGNAEANGANLSRTFILVNITASDNGVISDIVLRLFNATDSQINSSTSTTSPVFANFSGLSDGIYKFNATVNDTANNKNSTATRIVRVDTTFPGIDYQGTTDVSGANFSRNSIFVNVTVTEANEANITFTLYNSTSSYNVTTYSTAQRTFNWTSLADGTYTFNVTVSDGASNRNTTATRLNVTVDSVAPVVTINQPVATNLSTSSAVFNVTTNENTQFCNYTLNSGTTNYTMTNNGMRDFNGSNGSIADGQYTARYYCFDYAGNVNSSTTRGFGINSSLLTSTLVSPVTGLVTNTTSQNFSCNGTDDTGLSAIKLYIWNSSSEYATNATPRSGTGNATNWTYTITTNGNYTWNCLVNDTDNNQIFGTNRTFVIDTVSPAAPTHSCTPSPVTQGQAVACTCSSATDSLSGINTSYGTGGYSYTPSPTTQTVGSFNVTCTIIDYAGNSNSTVAAYTVNSISNSPAGPGGGGGEEKTEKTWTKVTPGAATIMHVEDFGVKQITIQVNNPAQDVTITVVKVAGQPASITKSIEGKVYKYLEIRTRNLDTTLDSATIQVRVEKSWATQNNIAKEKIVVYRYDSTAKSWQELATKPSGEDATYYFFDAVTKKFSIFAIAEKKVVAPTPTPTPTPTPEPTATPTVTPTPQEEVKGKAVWAWLIIAIVIIVLVAVGIVILMSKKNLREKIWVKESKVRKKFSNA